MDDFLNTNSSTLLLLLLSHVVLAVVLFFLSFNSENHLLFRNTTSNRTFREFIVVTSFSQHRQLHILQHVRSGGLQLLRIFLYMQGSKLTT